MRKNKIIFWTATVIIFLWEGLMPISTLLFAPQYATVGTRPLGYPDYFAYALIIFKLAGTLAIAIPKVPGKLKEWAYAGLTFTLIFAVISHCAIDMNIGFILLPVVIGCILAVSYFYKDKIQSNN
jgi:hypothetical protein